MCSVSPPYWLEFSLCSHFHFHCKHLHYCLSAAVIHSLKFYFYVFLWRFYLKNLFYDRFDFWCTQNWIVIVGTIRHVPYFRRVNFYFALKDTAHIYFFYNPCQPPPVGEIKVNTIGFGRFGFYRGLTKIFYCFHPSQSPPGPRHRPSKSPPSYCSRCVPQGYCSYGTCQRLKSQELTDAPCGIVSYCPAPCAIVSYCPRKLCRQM